MECVKTIPLKISLNIETRSTGEKYYGVRVIIETSDSSEVVVDNSSCLTASSALAFALMEASSGVAFNVIAKHLE